MELVNIAYEDAERAGDAMKFEKRRELERPTLYGHYGLVRVVKQVGNRCETAWKVYI